MPLGFLFYTPKSMLMSMKKEKNMNVMNTIDESITQENSVNLIGFN